MDGINIWAKSIVLAIIIVSILEMLLPNNNTKKYVKVVMGIFILYNIISPFIKDKSMLKFENLNLDTYSIGNKSTENSIEVNQESMDRRLEELYTEEIKKDIKKKVEKQGYIVKKCKVKANMTGKEDDVGIKKIELKVEKNPDNETKEKNANEEEIENKVVAKIQEIRKINTKVTSDDSNIENNKLSKVDIQNLKKFLIDEYEVNERCLEIN